MSRKLSIPKKVIVEQRRKFAPKSEINITESDILLEEKMILSGDKDNVTYSLLSELVFIKNLGTELWSEKIKTPRKVLLERYIASIENRKNWGGIKNVDKIIQYAQEQLSKEIIFLRYSK